MAASAAAASPTTSPSWAEGFVLVEQFDLTYGSTWHSAGLVGQLRSSDVADADDEYSVELYAALRRETGKDPGWHELGGIRLASSQARLEEIQRQAGWAKTFGLPLDIVSAAEAQERFPLMEPAGVLGAAWLPRDGYLDPSQLTFALAERRAALRRRDQDPHAGDRRSRARRPRCRRICRVVTEKGEIETEVVVERRRHGRARRGAARRRHRADHPYGAPVPHHRAVRPAARAAADAARPRQPRLLAHRGRRARDGRLRARARALGARRHSRGLRGPAPDRGVGALRGADSRARSGACPRWRTPRSRSSSTGRRRSRPTASSSSASRRCRGSGSPRGSARTASPAPGGIGKVMAEWIVEGQPEWDLWHMDIRRFGRQYRSQATRSRARRGLSTVLRHQVPGRGAQGRAAAARLARLRAPYEARRRFGEKSAAGSASTGSSPNAAGR